MRERWSHLETSASRAETVPDDAVWYAAYGSNLDPDRFGRYLLGGSPPGATRTYPGTRAGGPALDTRPFAMPGRLVFAWHSPTWDGSIAFHDPTGEGEVLSTAYLLPTGTFSDVVEQEMWREPGADHDLAEVLATGRQVLGPGRYETLHLTGELDGRPVVTFSADDPALLEPGRPAPAYLATMARGLRHAHRLEDDAIADYFLLAAGIAYDRDAVLRAIR
ncbi:histone deacetylase [Nocardioides sp. GXQ0305]|uniref:histone deacetylase n=1 Tax=Nocardioides sp. GXQ0305 TaxID=3423912 RepID=UPI003D7C6C97